MRRALVILLLLMPSMVLAQNNVGVTSAGTVVVAAMESVGYHAQNQILTSLNSMLSDLGALIYLCVVLSAVLTASLMGRYQAALWLLIGPPIFVYVSGVELGGQKNRITARGPDWQMGAFKGPEGVKEKVMGRQDAPTEVSFVFHKYNELISELYQLLINKITSEDASKPIMFMARQRAMEKIFTFDLTTPGGKALGGYFFAHCSQYVAYARILGYGKRNPDYTATSTYQNAKKEYCQTFDIKKVQFASDATVIQDYTKNLEPPYEKGNLVSCLEIWNWFRQSAAKDFAAQSEDMLNTILGPELAALVNNSFAKRLWDDIANKVSGFSVGPKEDCPFPKDAATQALDQSVDTPPSYKQLVNVFTALQIRKNNAKDSNATDFLAIIGGDMSGVTVTSDGSSIHQIARLGGRESMIKEQNARSMATARQFEAFNLLMLVPYFQGMILYMLAVTYPFFALTILVPGQAGSFFTWLALWAWAKSWDVGFAMIMVVDQLLWEILPKTTFFDSQTEYTPVDLLEMHYQGDNAYSVSMYWLIVSALIGAVPVVSAEAILGTKKAVGGALTAGLGDIASRLSNVVNDFRATEHTNLIQAAREQAKSKEGMLIAAQSQNALNESNRSMPNNKADGLFGGAGHNLGALYGTAETMLNGVFRGPHGQQGNDKDAENKVNEQAGADGAK